MIGVQKTRLFRATGRSRIMMAAVLSLNSISHAAVSASVANPADVIARFGLFGYWSPNCAAPASKANPRVIWGISNGAVVHSVSFDGHTVAVLDTVESATILDDHDLRLTHTGRGPYPKVVIVRLVDDHVRAIYSAASDGHVFYDQGVEVSTGRPSAIDERCEALTS